MTPLPLRATPEPWAALAVALGEHWRYVADRAAAGYDRPGGYALLEGRGDELLLVTDPDGRAGYGHDERADLPARVRVVGLFDRLTRRAGVTPADHAYVNNPHVTQALSKPAHVIARAIARDLLPGYRAALAQTVETAARRQARAAAADALLAQLAAYQPTTTITRPNGSGAWGDGSRRLYPHVPGDGHATVEIAEGETPRVTFKIETRDPGRAVALMAALMGLAGEAA